METSQPLTIESFSYSWLINQKPSLDHIFDQNNCNNEDNNTNFCFNLPHATNLVDADEVIFNGHIIPKSINQIKLYSCPATPVVHFPHKKPSKCTKKYSQLIASWRVSSKKLFRKCFSFLVPRKSTRIVDSSSNSVCISSSVVTFRRSKSWSHNSTSGSHISCSNDKAYHDYNEGSVHEAIVHCKRSLGNAF
ncbi:uncharacterized protein LOC143616303 [Bidens hawaiensis]|uniref:uncharacterized protein LOC143616303 n=1 Tax=Bidens hawaiensis TaxID=980011 RepID=UPI00404B3728